MAKAGVYHVTVHRGTDWNPIITIKVKATGRPKDLTDCEAYIEVFEGDWDGTQLAVLSSEALVPTITLGGVAGTVQPLLDATATAALAAGTAKWFLDIVWATGKRQRFLASNMYLSPDIVTPEPAP